MSQLRVGIIGSGGIARGVHIPNYQKIEGVEIDEKYTNGVKVINKNSVSVQVQVAILPSTY